MDVRTKRIYEAAAPDDGFRVLIDRLWPRGVSKERAHLDLWAKDAAPSTELRETWHHEADGHSPEKFAAFEAAYREELTEPPASDALGQLVALAREHSRLTLLYGARDTEINHAIVLREAILARAAGES